MTQTTGPTTVTEVPPLGVVRFEPAFRGHGLICGLLLLDGRGRGLSFLSNDFDLGNDRMSVRRAQRTFAAGQLLESLLKNCASTPSALLISSDLSLSSNAFDGIHPVVGLLDEEEGALSEDLESLSFRYRIQWLSGKPDAASSPGLATLATDGRLVDAVTRTSALLRETYLTGTHSAPSGKRV